MLPSIVTVRMGRPICSKIFKRELGVSEKQVSSLIGLINSAVKGVDCDCGVSGDVLGDKTHV